MRARIDMDDMDMEHDHDDHNHDHDDEPASGPSTEHNLCIDLDVCHQAIDEICLACRLDDPDHCPEYVSRYSI